MMNPQIQRLLDEQIKTELKCILADPLLQFTAGEVYKIKGFLERKNKRYLIVKNDEQQEVAIQLTESSKHFDDSYVELLEKIQNIKDFWT